MLIGNLILKAVVLPLLIFMSLDIYAADGEQVPEASWPIKKIGRSDARPKPTDLVVKLRQTKDGWLVDQEATLSLPGTEMLWLRQYEKGGEVIVMALPPLAGKEIGQSLCTFGVASSRDQTREKNGYTECTSEFLSCEARWTDAVLAIPFLLTASRTCFMTLDKTKVQKALESSKFFDWLKSEKTRLANAEYQRAFSRIADSLAAVQFIERYVNNDPDGLIPKAQAKREELLGFEEAAAATELIAAEKRAQNQKRIDQERIEEQRRIADAVEKEQLRIADVADESQRNRERVTVEFRKKIVIGSDTHCGPVINVRGPMVQLAVNAPLSGFSAEPWLKIQDVYPASVAGCRNTNGQLQPVFFK